MTTDDPNERGIAFARAGRFAEAAAAFTDALRVRPERASSAFNLALALARLGRAADAERAFERALRLAPDDADAHFQLAQLLQQLGRVPEAVVGYRNAAQFRPDWFEPWKVLGSLYFDLGQAAAAAEAFARAIAIKPDLADVHNDLGNAYRMLDRDADAVKHYREAARLNPGLAPAHANLGWYLADEGDADGARDCYRSAYRASPQPKFRILADTALPVLYRDGDQVAEVRSRLEANLHRLISEGFTLDPTADLMPTHFFLAYQGQNDKPLHELFAKLAVEPAERRVQIPVAKPSGGAKVRIGFISRYLRNHTIGNLNVGLVERLPRERFEVTVLSCGPRADDLLGPRFRAAADRYVDVPSRVDEALKQIAEQKLDILFYPDLGMDAQTYTLAFSRLAPVQVLTWGHPVTSGLTTLDHFITTVDLEPTDATAAYTERPAVLSRMAVWYERPAEPPPVPRSHFGLSDEDHVYACPQTLFKFHPEFDGVLSEILRRDPKGVLALIRPRHASWQRRLTERFAATMPDVAGRVRWVESQPRDRFLALMNASDVMLDPIHFGGGNTNYEAFSLGVPVVTWPSQLLRGRLTLAQYRQMGVSEFVASSAAEYVELAVRLGTDADVRRSARVRLREAAGALYQDDAAVAELANWFEARARP